MPEWYGKNLNSSFGNAARQNGRRVHADRNALSQTFSTLLSEKLVIEGAVYLSVGLYGDKRRQKDYSFWLIGIGATLLSLGVWLWFQLTGMPGPVFMVTAISLAIIGLVKSRIVMVIIAGIDLGRYGMHLVDVLWGQHLWVGVLLTLFGLVALGGGVFLRNRLRLTRRQPLRGSIWL